MGDGALGLLVLTGGSGESTRSSRGRLSSTLVEGLLPGFALCPEPLSFQGQDPKVPQVTSAFGPGFRVQGKDEGAGGKGGPQGCPGAPAA